MSGHWCCSSHPFCSPPQMPRIKRQTPERCAADKKRREERMKLSDDENNDDDDDILVTGIEKIGPIRWVHYRHCFITCHLNSTWFKYPFLAWGQMSQRMLPPLILLLLMLQLLTVNQSTEWRASAAWVIWSGLLESPWPEAPSKKCATPLFLKCTIRLEGWNVSTFFWFMHNLFMLKCDTDS